MSPQLSVWIKSAITSDLMFFNILLILEMYSPDKDMNFEIILVLISMMICLLERPFVVILILSFFPPWFIDKFMNFFDFQDFFDIRG